LSCRGGRFRRQPEQPPPKRSKRTELSAEQRLIYADSSALVKLIVDEPETEAVRAYLRLATSLITSRVATVEVTRAANLANPADDTRRAVDRLLRGCVLVSVSSPLLRSARLLASASLRTLDAIHLASAIRVEADELVAYDLRLLKAARDQGMRVVSPGR
jgi:predicted nucleic acid-binding protein